jgi:arylsulfatase A-like enzyme
MKGHRSSLESGLLRTTFDPAPRSVALVLGLLVSAWGVAACTPAGQEQPGDVLIVILDTTRADHLSCYGYNRPTTPHLDRLAAEGERHTRAYAQAPWTLPAVATILTGVAPHAHGAGRSAAGYFGIRPGVRTLAERLDEVGYRSAAFVNVEWCSPSLSHLDRGFDLYDFRSSDDSNRGQRDARETTDAVLAWLDALSDDERTFLVVHYFDPHLTYDPPAPHDTVFEPDDSGPRVPAGFGSAREVFGVRDGTIALGPRERESLIARYDGELRHVDEQFGRLRAALEDAGRWNDALVVVVADHGEEFWDHEGFEHGHTHHHELLHIPLIVRRPTGPRGVVHDARVRQLDIAPTVLEFAGAARDDLPGDLLDGRGARYSVAEGSLWSGDLVSARSDDGTVMLHRSEGLLRYYDPADRAEREPRPASTAPAAELLRILDALPTERTADDDPAEFGEEQLERLRSLGYIR